MQTNKAWIKVLHELISEYQARIAYYSKCLSDCEAELSALNQVESLFPSYPAGGGDMPEA